MPAPLVLGTRGVFSCAVHLDINMIPTPNQAKLIRRFMSERHQEQTAEADRLKAEYDEKPDGMVRLTYQRHRVIAEYLAMILGYLDELYGPP